MRDKLEHLIAKWRDDVQVSAKNDYKTPCPTVPELTDQILALPAPGWVVKGVDESKWPMFRFKCARGHGSWVERQAPNHGRSVCKVCRKESDTYNAMLREKNYNWPLSFNIGERGTIIEEAGDWETPRPATLAEVLDGQGVRT